MAHLHGRHAPRHDESAAIFSPSVARIAASTARDWSYVDSWLASKFPGGRPIPSFERNPDTLRALLALAAANETADDERRLLARADAAALEELKRHHGHQRTESASARLLRSRLLSAIQHELPGDGKNALDCLANVAVWAGAAFPEPEDLGRNIVSMQCALFETEHMIARVNSLQCHIQREADRAADLLHSLQSHLYRPSSDSAKQNLDLQRKIKAMSAQLLELRDRSAANKSSSVDAAHTTIEDVSRLEHDFLALLALKKELDIQGTAVQGLSGDPDMARTELDALRSRLQDFTSRRDAMFEGMAERESSVRRR